MSPLTHGFFRNFLPVVDIIEILDYSLIPRDSELMAFLKNGKLMMIMGDSQIEQFPR